MSRLSTLAVLLLAALWLPSSLHCRLESLELSELFSCAGHASEETSQPHSSEGCAGSVCENVESGQIAPASYRLSAARPLAQAGLNFVSLLTLIVSAPAGGTILPPAELSPPWQPSWHFVRRTALPARAPDRIA